MIVAFIQKEQQESRMVKYCDLVVRDSGKQPIVESLIDFIEEYQDKQLLIPDNIALKIQLVQLLPVLEKAEECGIILYFEAKRFFPEMTDQDYFRMSLSMARMEKNVMANRSRAAVADLKAQGIFIGRPKITPETIAQIRRLSVQHGKSMREIAAICEVSVGTVHKYTVTN